MGCRFFFVVGVACLAFGQLAAAQMLLGQGGRAGPYTLAAGACRVFYVDFDGGVRKSIKIKVWNADARLNYVAAGLGRYGSMFVDGAPSDMASCSTTYESVGCWGPDPSDVKASAYYGSSGGCGKRVDPVVMDLTGDSPAVDGKMAEFEFVASKKVDCLTEDGRYYFYARAGPTPGGASFDIEVDRAGVKKSDDGVCDATSGTTAAAVAVTIAIIIAVCVCVCVAAFFGLQQHRSLHFHRTHLGGAQQVVPLQQQQQQQQQQIAPYHQPPPQVVYAQPAYAQAQPVYAQPSPQFGQSGQPPQHVYSAQGQPIQALPVGTVVVGTTTGPSSSY